MDNKDWGDSTHLRPVRHVFSAVADEPNGFHTGVRKCSITHKLRQTLHCILERVNGRRKMLLKRVHCEETERIDMRMIFLNFYFFLNIQDASFKIMCNCRYLLTMCPVVWNARSTMFSSWSDAAWWNTENMFFQPERILAAWEFTIWATQRITMSRMVGDL